MMLGGAASLVASLAEAVHLHGARGVEFLPAATLRSRARSLTGPQQPASVAPREKFGRSRLNNTLVISDG